MGKLADLVDAVNASTPRLGSVRLVTIDGPAGSGKTVLADRLAAGLGGAPVVHLDDLYDGWSGLEPDLWRRLLAGVLEPLAAGRAGRYRRYDWHLGRFAEEKQVGPAPVVIVEGVGAGARQVDDRAVLRLWVEAPRDVRLARGLARDGEAMRDDWLRWADLEQAHFRGDRTRDRADVVLDGQQPLPD